MSLSLTRCERSVSERPRVRRAKGSDSLHPSQRLMHISIDHGHILQPDRTSKSELINTRGEVSIEEAAMVDGETDCSADELEVVEVLGVDGRVGVELEGVVALLGVLEEAEGGVEDGVGEEEEELAVSDRRVDVSCGRNKRMERGTHRETPPKSTPSSPLNVIINRFLRSSSECFMTSEKASSKRLSRRTTIRQSPGAGR
jgi:hypothetical protein